MSTTLAGLILSARRALHVGSQGDFGVMMGSSRRSGQRWATGKAHPSGDQVVAMARLVYPHDAAIAAQLAAAAGTTLLALGLVKPAPAPQPPSAAAPPAPAVEDIVDAIVCAASDAMNALPREVRPALLAAFARARRLGLSMEAVEKALGAK